MLAQEEPLVFAAHIPPMAITHALPGQVVEVQPLRLRLLYEKTAALFKAQDLEVMRPLSA